MTPNAATRPTHGWARCCWSTTNHGRSSRKSLDLTQRWSQRLSSQRPHGVTLLVGFIQQCEKSSMPFLVYIWMIYGMSIHTFFGMHIHTPHPTVSRRQLLWKRQAGDTLQKTCVSNTGTLTETLSKGLFIVYACCALWLKKIIFFLWESVYLNNQPTNQSINLWHLFGPWPKVDRACLAFGGGSLGINTRLRRCQYIWKRNTK